MASSTFPANPPQSPMQAALRLAQAGPRCRSGGGIAPPRRTGARACCSKPPACRPLQQLGERAAALEALDRAIAHVPHDAALHETRAGALLTLERPADAELAARAALAIARTGHAR
jgi:hypothetical protein